MDVNKLLNTDVTGIDTEPKLMLPKKHTNKVTIKIVNGTLYVVWLVNYSNGLKKWVSYSGNNSGWHTFIMSFKTKSGLAVPSS